MSTMYLVARRALDSFGGACEDQTGIDTGSRVPLRMFTTRLAAEAFIAAQMIEARRTMNPFQMIGGYVGNDIQKQLGES